MLGMDAFTSPAGIRTMAKLLGLTAARLDYESSTDTLYLSYRQKGTTRTLAVPCGVTYTAEQIVQLLMGQPAAIAPGPARASAETATDLNRQPVGSSASPP